MEYVGTCTPSQHNDEKKFAAARPSLLGQRSAALAHSHVENSTKEREIYWKNNAPVQEKLDWNSTTSITLYTKLTQVKKTTHKCTIQAISNNQASWQDRAEEITNCFQQDVPAARTAVENAVMDHLLSYDFENYEFKDKDKELYDSNLRIIPFGNALVHLPANAWNRTKWIGFTLLVRTRLCDVCQITINVQCLPPMVTAQVYIHLLKEIGAGLLHPMITRFLLQTTPKDLIEIYESEGAGFILQQLIRYNHAPDMDAHKIWLEIQKAKTMYKGLCQIMQQGDVENGE